MKDDVEMTISDFRNTGSKDEAKIKLIGTVPSLKVADNYALPLEITLFPKTGRIGFDFSVGYQQKSAQKILSGLKKEVAILNFSILVNGFVPGIGKVVFVLIFEKENDRVEEFVFLLEKLAGNTV